MIQIQAWQVDFHRGKLIWGQLYTAIVLQQIISDKVTYMDIKYSFFTPFWEFIELACRGGSPSYWVCRNSLHPGDTSHILNKLYQFLINIASLDTEIVLAPIRHASCIILYL